MLLWPVALVALIYAVRSASGGLFVVVERSVGVRGERRKEVNQGQEQRHVRVLISFPTSSRPQVTSSMSPSSVSIFSPLLCSTAVIHVVNVGISADSTFALTVN